jgi:hypothetical protein
MTSRSLLAITALFLTAALAGIGKAAEPLEDAMRGTVRISEGDSSATAFVVDLGEEAGKEKRFALVSAAHVFEEMRKSTCTVHFRAADGKGGFSRHATDLKVREGDKPLWVRQPSADVAAIFVELPEKVDVVPFEIGQIANEDFFDAGKLRIGQEVYVPCFPAKIESNEAGFPILRKGSIATFPLTSPTVGDAILIDYSHFGGDSGSPVVTIVDDEPIVVGVATAMLRQMDTVTSEFEERTTHTPLGLASAVRSVLVLETLEKLKQAR